MKCTNTTIIIEFIQRFIHAITQLKGLIIQKGWFFIQLLECYWSAVDELKKRIPLLSTIQKIYIHVTKVLQTKLVVTFAHHLSLIKINWTSLHYVCVLYTIVIRWLIVYRFTSWLKIFHFYENVAITGERLENPLNKEGGGSSCRFKLPVYMYVCDTSPRFLLCCPKNSLI
jgi:hypothetical protein